MADLPLMPLAGMNNAAEEAALMRGGDSPAVFARDVVNINVSPAGKARLRDCAHRVSTLKIRELWQSPLHRESFGAVGDEWGKVGALSWSFDPMVSIGNGPVSHEVLNNLVCVAGDSGIFTYDGSTAQKLTIENPPAPLVVTGSGSMVAGVYGVAMAWLRGSTESAPSAIAFADVSDSGSMQIILPMCLDDSVTGVRLYMTRQNGGELARAGDYQIDATTIDIPALPKLGAPPQFLNKSPMPTGKYLKYWRGRLLTSRANVLRFSEPMAYHLHDERHGFVQMPQRITFVEPVDGGIWVGQVDHVAFLEGATPDELVMQRKTACAPVAGSSIQVLADTIGGELSQGGSATVLWLAENGYVAGTASGQVVEMQAGVMKGIAAENGTSVVLDRRVLTAVT